MLTLASTASPVRLGRYDVVGVLGRGAMGVVFEAIEEGSRQRVALKVMTWRDGAATQRFREEFRAAAEVRHPNLVQLYELVQDEDLTYFAMERVEGVPFVAWARGLRLDELGEAALRRALAQLVRGVDALHRSGILHLDLKPCNVLVTARERVVVLDFGLAHRLDRLRAERGMTGGTLAYMAPEQGLDLALVRTTDWYAVGTMLYEILCGVLPFEGLPSALATLTAKNRGELDPPHVVAPQAPRALLTLCAALLAPRPDARPDVGAILSALGDPEAPPTAVGLRRLVGRDSELATLRETFELARATQRLRLVRVQGLSGLGKSALAHEAFATLRRRGAWTLEGRCHLRERVPHKGLDEVLASLARRLDRVPDAGLSSYVPTYLPELVAAFPVFGEVEGLARRTRDATLVTSPARQQRMAWESLAEVLFKVADRHGLAIHVDDLQWAGEDTIERLRFLVERLRDTRTMLVVSHRSGALPFAAPLWQAGRAHAETDLVELALAPLSPEDALALAHGTLAELGLDPGLAPRVATESLGHPILIEELARQVDARGAPASASLEELVRGRLEDLPLSSRALLAMLAVAGTPIEPDVVLAAAGMSANDVGLLWDLQAKRLVRSSGALVDTYHDRIREVVLQALVRPRQESAAHLALARAVAARHAAETGTWPIDVVRHYQLAGGPPADERVQAARLAFRAARIARAGGALRDALELCELGIAWAGDGAWHAHHALMLDLHRSAAETASLLDDPSRLGAVATTMIANARSPIDATAAWTLLIDAAVQHPQLGDARSMARTALAALGHPFGPDELAETRVVELGERLRSHDDASLVALPRANDPTVSAAVRVLVSAFSNWSYSHVAMRVTAATQGASLWLEHGWFPEASLACVAYAVVLNERERFEEGARMSRLAIRMLDRTSDAAVVVGTRVIASLLGDAWLPHVATTVPQFDTTYALGCANGEHEYATLAAAASLRNRFHASLSLPAALALVEARRPWLERFGTARAMPVLELNRALVRALVEGPEAAPDLASGVPGDGLVSISPVHHAVFALSAGIVAFHFGEPGEAARRFGRLLPFADCLASSWHAVMLRQYGTLALIDGIEELDDPAAARACVLEGVAVMQRWAAKAPVNFAHRAALLAAEATRIGAPGDRTALLEEAIRGARAGGWEADLAFALARAGDVDGARRAYERWGAEALARRVESATPGFRYRGSR
jgi:predicted ATPase/predicted Ser/Thr protein kinase